MMNAVAVISMLHEQADTNSATRLFRDQPVLAWTLRRLQGCRRLNSVALICWDDQLQQVAEAEVEIISAGQRAAIPSLDAVTAARRWSGGWRGGLLGTCDFDLGFHAPSVLQAISRLSSDAAILIDPSAGLLDPKIIDAVVDHAQARPHLDLVFTQAAPGLAGTLLRHSLLERLAQMATHPGRLLHYLPDQPCRDPISGEGCVPVPAPLARTTRSFRLDSNRQIARLTTATSDLNGQLMTIDTMELLRRLEALDDADPLPREIVLELNTSRVSSPIFWPGRFQRIDRPPISTELAEKIFDQIASADDVRLTLCGVGDPLLHDQLFSILQLARSKGLRAVHVETDLLADQEKITCLVESGIDVVSVHFPAITPATYSTVMGTDRFGQALENIRQFVLCRHQRGGALPILVPIFTKCAQNLVEMEGWYDRWLRALGSALIVGPSDYAGLIPDCGVADMSPPQRRPCRRLWSRMTILSDGTVAACEQDILGRQVLGDVNCQSLSKIWHSACGQLRIIHQSGQWNSRPVCAACRQWHRP